MSTGKAYFISDAHLGVFGKEATYRQERALVRFLKRIEDDCEYLFLVGDIFDFWFEYHFCVPRLGLRLLGHLADMAEQGVKIYFLGGNHDFWLNRTVSDYGVTVVDGNLDITIFGKRFFISHGDGIAKSDWRYRCLLKPFLRNPLNNFLFGILHPDIGFVLAKLVSHTSRDATKKRKIEFEEEYIDFAKDKLSKGFDYVVVGHIHFQRIEKLDAGGYAQIGNWIWERNYLVFDGETLSGKSFDG